MNGFICIKCNKTQFSDSVVSVTSDLDAYRKEEFDVNGSAISLFSIEDGDKVQGRAEDEKCLLIFSGVLQYPLPDWHGSVPSESPDKSAKYLLGMYARNGTGFLNNIFGQFVVLIINKVTGEIVTSTDGNGYRRLLVVKKDNFFSVGTHLNFYSSLVENSSLDLVEQAFFLSYEFLPDNKTIYPGVEYLSSSEVVISNDRVESIRKKYSKIEFLEDHMPSEESKVFDLLHEEFLNSIKRQVPEENKIAVLLGGFDSAIIASVLNSLGKEVETFSFYFEDNEYNQKYTDLLSKVLGIKHNWVQITPEVIEQGILKYPEIFNHPSSLAHYHIQTNYVVEQIKNRGFKYCFTGDGCDELFLGYPTVYRRAMLFNKLGVMPKTLVSLIRYLLSLSFIEDRLGHISRISRNIFLVLGRRMPERGFIANRIFDEFSLSRLMYGRGSHLEALVEKKLHDVSEKYSKLSIARLAYAGKSMVSSTKNKIEGSSLNAGVIIQSPFFDERFRQFVSMMPESYVRPLEKEKQRSIGKYAFVEMAIKYNLLPEDIILQKKASPVTAPIDDWYAGDLKKCVVESISSFPHRYNKKYIEKILKPKLLEMYMRRKMLGKYTMITISMLVTYSSYFRMK